MRKMRSLKKIAFLTVLMFLFTLLPAGFAMGASLEYAKISASFTYVDDDDGQAAGTVTALGGEDYDDSVVDAIYMEIELNDGVEITDADVANLTLTNATEIGTTKSSSTVSADNVAGFDVAATAPEVAFDSIDVPSGMSGNITADVTVWATDAGGAVLWEETATVTIAKVASGDVAIEVEDAETLTVGSNRAGAVITIKELSPGAFDANDEIFLTVKNSDVTWDTVNMSDADVSQSGISIDATVAADDFTGDDTTFRMVIDNTTTTLKGRLEITPRFKVQPGAEGDVEVKIQGDTVDTTTVLVATVGAGDVSVDVEDAEDDTIYRGQAAEFDDVVVTLDPATQLNDGEYITITLPDGFEWDDSAGDPVTDDAGADIAFNSLYDSDQSLWIDVVNDEANDVELSSFMIIADADAPLGDVEITFGGAVEGTYVIGQCEEAFTITCEPTNVPLLGSDIALNKIVITEATDEALVTTDDNDDKDDMVPGWFDIELPMGVAFADTPEVDVEDGNLSISGVELVDDDSVLRFQIDGQSSVESVIEITDIELDIDNRAVPGDIVAKVGKEYNIASSKALTTVVLGKIVGEESGRTGVFTIGSTTYTLNGDEMTMDVAPYIKDSRTYLPMRYVGQALGVSEQNILWNNGTATFIKGDRVVQVKIGSTNMLVNGASVTMDVAPEIVDGRTMMPIRWIGVAFGADLTWDNEAKTVTVEN